MAKKGVLRGINGVGLKCDLTSAPPTKKRKSRKKRYNMSVMLLKYAKRCPICNDILQKLERLPGVNSYICNHCRRHW